jgi:PilZ domain-containing protein
MGTPNDKKLADLAVSILSQLASPTVDVFSADGGVLSLELKHQEGDYIVATAPRLRVRLQLELLARTTETAGGGYDIELTVAEILYESEWLSKLHLRVRDVRRRDSHRATARARIEELAQVHVIGAKAIAENETFDVRLADLSPSGVAFVTERQFTIGDRLALMATVGGRVVRMQARVLQTSSSHYGRQRVGCEILQITDDDRRRVADLTSELPASGSAEQRRGRVR